MRLLVSLLLLSSLGTAVDLPVHLPYYTVIGNGSSSWPEILSAIGFERRPAEKAHIIVAGHGSAEMALPVWTEQVQKGAILILEGESPLAESFGFRPAAPARRVSVGSLTDIHGPDLAIIWEKQLDLPGIDIPSAA